MSPAWTEEVFRVLQDAINRDAYFRGVVARFNLRLVYVVRGIPAALRGLYGGSQAVISVHVSKGAIRGLAVSGEMPESDHQLLLDSDYKTAKQLLLGQASPVNAFLTRRLTVRPSDGFHQWPRHVPKALIAARLILKLARGVPAGFETSA